MPNMGFYGQDEWSGPGGPFPAICFKRKNRWRFIIPGISASGVNSLPPFRGGKPSMSFKEMQAEHLNETIFFPSKPDWKPLTLTLYDIVKTGENPVFSWLRKAYDPKNCSLWNPSVETATNSNALSNESGGLKIAQCFLELYDGCGQTIEQWVFEHAWPQSVEFADGDMSSNEVVTCDVTLRFDRAYINTPSTTMANSFPTEIPSYTCSAVPASFSPLSFVAFEMAPEFMIVRPNKPEPIQIR